MLPAVLLSNRRYLIAFVPATALAGCSGRRPDRRVAQSLVHADDAAQASRRRPVAGHQPLDRGASRNVCTASLGQCDSPCKCRRRAARGVRGWVPDLQQVRGAHALSPTSNQSSPFSASLRSSLRFGSSANGSSQSSMAAPPESALRRARKGDHRLLALKVGL